MLILLRVIPIVDLKQIDCFPSHWTVKVDRTRALAGLMRWPWVGLPATHKPVICMCCVLNCFIRVRLYVKPWTVAHQAPLSMGFSRQEYWSGLSFPSVN